jgi:hypothetical protein
MLNSTQDSPENVRWTCHVIFQQSENACGDALVCADALDKNRVEYTGMYIVTRWYSNGRLGLVIV